MSNLPRLSCPEFGKFIISFVVLCALAGSWRSSMASELHVAPQGDDANTGSSDEPFATIERARRAARERIAAGLDEDLVIVLHGTVHRIESPLVFGPGDGGTRNHAVRYAAAPGEAPVISGGRLIAGWAERPDGTWETTVPGDWRFRELFVNGERRQRARHPNDGYLRIEKAGPDNRTSFTYQGHDLRAYPDLTDVELVFLHDWSISRVRLAAVDEGTRTVRLEDPVGPASRHFAMNWFEPRPRYFLENSASFLDQPGEWHLDTSTGRLRYRPLAGERPDRVEVVAPLAPRLVEVRGDVATGRPVLNLHFAGIRFEHMAWSLPPNGYAAGQAGFHERRKGEGGALREPLEAALQFDLAEGCGIRDCSISHVGQSGIWLRERCRSNRVVGTVVQDVSGNGVMIGEDRHRHVDGRPWWQAAPDQVASGNVVENCLVAHCGRQFFGSVGIWVGIAEKTRIAHNEIHGHPYTGVSLGWMWSPAPTPCRENVVEANHIHHVMQTLSDGGGIYTLGLQPGSALRGNHIHDVPRNAGRAESNGMFLDEGTTDFVIEENVIHATDRSPLRFHRATTNLVRANVLVVTSGLPPVRYNNTKEADIRMIDNTVTETLPSSATGDIRRRAGPEPAYRERLGTR